MDVEAIAQITRDIQKGFDRMLEDGLASVSDKPNEVLRKQSTSGR